MSKNGGDHHLVQLELLVSQEEEKEFLDYVHVGKFATTRLAFVHLLRTAKGEEMAEGKEDDEPNEEAKEEPKKGKGRKGKKAMEDAASDLEMKKADDAHHAGEVAEEKPKDDEAKKAKGRQGKKAAEEHLTKTEERHDEADPKEDGEGEKQAKKRGRAVKGGAKNGKPDAAVEDPVKDATFNVADAASHVPDEPKPKAAAKKGARGKKAAAAGSDEEMHEDDENAAAEAAKGKPSKTEAPAETKKPRGKGKNVDDEDYQEPPAATKGRGKKAAVETAQGDTGDHEDESAADGDGKKGGKRKQAAAKAVAAGEEETEEGAVAAKPKRGRAAKQNKNYTEHAEGCC